MVKTAPTKNLAALLEVSTADELLDGLKGFELALLRAKIEAIYPAKAGQEKLALLENVDSMLRDRKLTFDRLYRSVHSSKPSAFAKMVLAMLEEYQYEFDELFANHISRWRRTVAGKEYQRSLERGKAKLGAIDPAEKLTVARKKVRKAAGNVSGIEVRLPTDLN